MQYEGRLLFNISQRRILFLLIFFMTIYIFILIIIRLVFSLDVIFGPPDKYEYTRRYKDYCILPNIFNNQEDHQDRITQIVHVSWNYLDEGLIEQVENWNAPVSLAIVIPHLEYFNCVMKRLKLLVSISPITARFLRVHLVYPSSWTATCTDFPLIDTECFDSAPSPDDRANYPVNIAKNAARMYSYSKYILFANYKHLFSEGFEEKVREVAERELQNDKKLLVYRAFEIEETAVYPGNKEELEKLIQTGEAGVPYNNFYTEAKDIPELKEWFAENSTDNGMFLRDLKFTKLNLEPHFVSRRHIPLHDINFPFLAMDNTVLLWELCRMDYSMDVLSNHFMFHRGIKSEKNSTESAPIQAKNYFRYREALANFTKRMDEGFPDESGRCPDFGR